MLRARQKLGKYRIEKRLARGGFADVYRAFDTIEGSSVALKVLHAEVSRDIAADFRKEVRLSASLDHPNILKIKNADVIGEHFIIAYPLAHASLDERMRTRIATRKGLDLVEQMINALAHAHENRIIHCDIKPENFLLFDDGELRLGDFGIARLSLKTRVAHVTGSGTLGYMAPEHALGRPSFRSDVFSLGLVIYRMFAGTLPEWPYEWPPPGIRRLRQKLHPAFVEILRRSLEVRDRRRYRDATQMLTAYMAIRQRTLRRLNGNKARRGSTTRRDWKAIRFIDFKRRHGRSLEVKSHCSRCQGPVSETMTHCPWCGSQRRVYTEEPRFPLSCRRCGRGLKMDWRYCPWCYGAGYEPSTTRRLSDRRYGAKCSNAECDRKLLMPFMRYCPWCRRKVKQKWKIAESREKCPRCSWGVLKEYWDFCPWCGRGLKKRMRT